MFLMFSQKFQKSFVPSVIFSVKIVEGWVRVAWGLYENQFCRTEQNSYILMLYMTRCRKYCFKWSRGAWSTKIYNIWENWSNVFWRLSEGCLRVDWGLTEGWKSRQNWCSTETWKRHILMLYMIRYRKFCFTWYKVAWSTKMYHIWDNWSNGFWRLPEGWVSATLTQPSDNLQKPFDQLSQIW